MPEVKTSPDAELEALAFEIFKSAVAGAVRRTNGRGEAESSFKLARTFLETRQQHRGGKLSLEPVPPHEMLQDCHAPRLAPWHPINLVSQRFGDAKKCQQIAAWLDKHPEARRGDDSNDDEVLSELRRELPNLKKWDLPELHTARVVFAPYRLPKG